MSDSVDKFLVGYEELDAKTLDGIAFEYKKTLEDIKAELEGLPKYNPRQEISERGCWRHEADIDTIISKIDKALEGKV